MVDRVRFSCGLNGQCEQDPQGRYRKREDCQRQCGSVDSKEVQYLIFGYSPEMALDLSPRDRIELVKRETGLIVDATASYNILLGLGTDDLTLLARYPELHNYLFSRYSSIDVRKALQEVATPESVRTYLSKYILTNATIKRFITNSNHNPLVYDILYDSEVGLLNDILLPMTSTSVPALEQLFRLYPDIDPRDLFEGGIVHSPAVLDELVARGFEDIIQDNLSDIYEKELPSPTIKKLLQLFPSTRNVMTLARSIANGHRNFAQVVSNSPALGRGAGELLADLSNDIIYADLEAVYYGVLPYVDFVSDRIDLILELYQIFDLPREEALDIVRRVWWNYMDEILIEENVEMWIEAVYFLATTDPSWYVNDGTGSFFNEELYVEENRLELTAIATEYIKSRTNYSVEYYNAIRAYIMHFKLVDIQTILIYDVDLLYDDTHMNYTEADIRSVLSEVVDPIAIHWIVQHFPTLESEFNLYQQTVLYDARASYQKSISKEVEDDVDEDDVDVGDRMEGEIPRYTCRAGTCELQADGEFQGYQQCKEQCEQ